MPERLACTCAPRVTCPACRAWARQPRTDAEEPSAGPTPRRHAAGTYYARHRARRLAYQRQYDWEARTRTPQLACCKQWQKITTLPHRCSQCGQVYLQRTPETARKAPGSPVRARRGGGATFGTSHTPPTARRPSQTKGN